MYNKFLGGRNYEKDIERAIVTQIASPSYIDAQIVHKLAYGVAASATTCLLNKAIPGVGARNVWLIIDPFTVQCEVREATAVTNTQYTFAALDFNHAADDLVLWTTEPIFNVRWWGAVGDNSTNDRTAIQACVDGAPDDSTIYSPIGDYVNQSSIQIYGRKHLLFTGPGVYKADGAVLWDIQDTAGASTEYNRWEGMHFEGDLGYACFKFTSGNSTGIRHNYIVDCDINNFKYGVRTVSGGTNMRKVIVRDSRMTCDDTADSVGVLFESDDSECKDNVIRGFETGVGIRGKANHITGNHIFKSPSDSTVCDIAVGRTSEVTDECAGTTIINNYMDGQPSDGQLVINVRAGRKMTVVGNQFRNESTGGPFVRFEIVPATGTWDIQDVTVTGNVFRCASGTLTNGVGMISNVETAASENFYFHSNTWSGVTNIYTTSENDRQVGTYATPYTPNPFLGRLLEITLTGNITINSPTNANMGGIGNRLTFLFIQDGTGGRTVTWNSVYKHKWFNGNPTASSRSSITFEWDGTNWNQVGGQVPYNDTWINYSSTSTVTGWSSTTTKNIYYKISKNLCYVRFRIEGTSNATTASFTLPKANNSNTEIREFIRGIDNGGAAALGTSRVTTSGSTANLYPALSYSGTWTASGTKSIAGSFWYKIA